MFMVGQPTPRGAMGCYNPWNYQSRTLLSPSVSAHAVGPCGDFEPSFDSAVSEMLRFDWIGLTEFYHESICLLLFRIEGDDHPCVDTRTLKVAWLLMFQWASRHNNMRSVPCCLSRTFSPHQATLCHVSLVRCGQVHADVCMRRNRRTPRASRRFSRLAC